MGNFNLWPKRGVVSKIDYNKATALTSQIISDLSDIKIVEYSGIKYGETKTIATSTEYDFFKTVELDGYYYVLGRSKVADENNKYKFILVVSTDRTSWKIINLNVSYTNDVSVYFTYYNSIYYLFAEGDTTKEILYCTSLFNVGEVEFTQIQLYEIDHSSETEEEKSIELSSITNYNFYTFNDKTILCVNNDFYISDDGKKFVKMDLYLYGKYEVLYTLNENATKLQTMEIKKENASLVENITFKNTLFGQKENGCCFCNNIIKKISNICLKKDSQLWGFFLRYNSCYIFSISVSNGKYYIKVTILDAVVKTIKEMKEVEGKEEPELVDVKLTLYDYLHRIFVNDDNIQLEFMKNISFFITISENTNLISFETNDFVNWIVYDNNATVINSSTKGYLPAENIISMSEFKLSGLKIYKSYITKINNEYNTFILLFGNYVLKNKEGEVVKEYSSIALNSKYYSLDYHLCTDSLCLYYYNKEESEIILTFVITEKSDKVIPTTQYVTKAVDDIKKTSLKESEDGSGDIGKISSEEAEKIGKLPNGSFICIV